ncbi:cycloartenol synthase [Artemisia annua]|uniref:Cycloartenol synthase n=1 Tax=Artemisia annua TaxID=35608 RepID=A0A2U1QM31_ARTAN|nr:cycloartenol synthase [Artemisia annua]
MSVHMTLNGICYWDFGVKGYEGDGPSQADFDISPNTVPHQNLMKDYLQKIYGLEIEESNVLNGGKPGSHQITGNGIEFKPDILDIDIMEDVLMLIFTTIISSFYPM